MAVATVQWLRDELGLIADSAEVEALARSVDDNGAVYLVEMEADGGAKSHPTNKAGAKYGTGYCDAQCPHDVKWSAGEARRDPCILR